MRKRRTVKGGRIFLILLTFLIVIVLFFFLLRIKLYDSKLFETVVAISEIRAKQITNEVIDHALNQSIDEMQVQTEDFFITADNNGMAAITVDTLLVNRFCTNVSTGMAELFKNRTEEVVSVPLGVITGLYYFANKGPLVTFSILPAGEAIVNYETAFTTAGINQTNFKIWINVESSIKIANPLIEKDIALNRKIMLVDTVIKGEVPQQYLDWNSLQKN